MTEQSCCFTGHRDIDTDEIPNIEKKVRHEVLHLISVGVNTFFCGGAVGFDMICGKIVAELKQTFSSVKLILALPCPQQNKYYTQTQNSDYEFLKKHSDKIYYASDHYHNGCMHERNRFMVDLSHYVICYCNKSSGGTFYTIKYAAAKNKTIINI